MEQTYAGYMGTPISSVPDDGVKSAHMKTSRYSSLSTRARRRQAGFAGIREKFHVLPVAGHRYSVTAAALILWKEPSAARQPQKHRIDH